MAPPKQVVDVESQDSSVHSLDGSRFRKFANPGPLGLSAFALTTLFLSLINAQARSVTVPNLVIGLAFAYGGFAQFMAGMWEFACGNTFGAVAFTSYGSFWISFAMIFVPAFNIAGAYTNSAEFANAVGIYLTSWCLFTGLLTVATTRTNVALFSLFLTLTIVFALLASGYFMGGDATLIKAGGYLGIITALIAFYNAMATLWTYENSYIKLPVGEFPWSERSKS